MSAKFTQIKKNPHKVAREGPSNMHPSTLLTQEDNKEPSRAQVQLHNHHMHVLRKLISADYH